MPSAYSIHIGSDRTNGYAGTLGGAIGCVEAASEMEKLAASLNYTHATQLSSEDAAWGRVTQTIRAAGAALKDGDLLLLTMAAHGMAMDGDGEGCEEHDQALLLYDTYLIDNTLYDLCREITARAFVVIVAEGCYSGNIHINLVRASFSRTGRLSVKIKADEGLRRCPQRPMVTADVLLLAATSPTNLTGMGSKGVVPPFTRALLAALPESRSYADLKDRINDQFPVEHQTCVLDVGLVKDRSPLLSAPPFRLP